MQGIWGVSNRHDDYFWLSVAEAKRVLEPGGYLIIGVPGFSKMGEVPGRRLLRRLARLPFVGKRWLPASLAADASSLALGIHEFPGDYYCFSEQAMTDVLLDGLDEIRTWVILSPPRIVGLGRKPAGAPPAF